MMKAERQIAMVKSVAKNMRAKERKEMNTEKMKDKMYAILKKAGKALDEVTKEDINKKDHEFLVEYVTDVMKCPIILYPNLQ